MRQSNKIRMAGAAGLNALVIGSMLLAQGRPVSAQNAPSNAGDAPVVNRTNAIAGPGANIAADGQMEARMLIAHGLEMTIEGSTLQGLAMRSAGVGVGPAVDSRPSPAGVVGSSSIRSITPATPVARVPVPTTTAGTGYTGAAGETVSGRPVGNGNEITPRTPIAGLPGGPQPGVTDPTAVVTPMAPLTAGGNASMLQRQAMRAFEAGERLLGGGMVGGPDKAFQQAATQYANTLRMIASQPVIRVTPPAVGTTVNTPIGAVTVATTPATTRPAETVGADPASVALINHAVKEALAAMKIRRLIRNEGGSSGPAGQILMEHAQMMESESRATIRAFAGIGDAGPVARAAGELGSPNGTVQALAQQADYLITALQGPAAPEPAGPGR